MPKLPPRGPGLGDFILKSQVRQQHKNLLRLAFRLPHDNPARGDLVKQIHEGFRQYKHSKDADFIRVLLVDASRKQKTLEKYVGGYIEREDDIVTNVDDADFVRITSKFNNLGIKSDQHTADFINSSSMYRSENQPGSIRKGDIRYRVGEGWPWQNKGHVHASAISRPLNSLYGDHKGRPNTQSSENHTPTLDGINDS